MFDLIEQAQSDRVQELSEQLRTWRVAYEAGHPIVSDDVYDACRDELKQLQADAPEVVAVGAPVPTSEWAKAAHGLPMGSLDKVNLPPELDEWASKLEGLPEGGNQWAWSEKLDGAGIHLRYENGVLIQAITRGDGSVGEDIVQNVRKMKGVVEGASFGFTGSIRGEIMLFKSDHATHHSGYSSRRNAAAGISKRYDGRGVEHLTVVVYSILDGDMACPDDQFEDSDGHLRWLALRGFVVPTHGVATLEEVKEIWRRYQAETRGQLDYDIDGLVIKLNDLTRQYALGEKDGRPVGATAFKFEAPKREARITKIEWQVGATGRITPVAYFTPVELFGATITQASVYNIAYIRKLGLRVGGRVLIARANDVIPRVVSCRDPAVQCEEAPSHCPVCGSGTQMDGEHLTCPNTADCPAQAVGRIGRWIAALDIKEWGDTLIERLVATGKVKSVPDLYRLTVADLAEMDRLSEKMGEKLRILLWEKNPIPLEIFLGGLSIPGCATSTIRLVMDHGRDTLEKMQSALIDDFLKIPGLGPVKSQALTTWFLHHRDLVDDLLARGIRIRDVVRGSLSGKSFCFTGTMRHKRPDLEAMAVAAGGVVKGSVSKGLTYLVIADPTSTSSKAQAARKNGTTCISEDDFLALLN